MFESLIQNHPFLDGNTRTALAAADIHLRIHGYELGGDSEDHYRFIIELMAGGQLDWRAIHEWLRRHVEGT